MNILAAASGPIIVPLGLSVTDCIFYCVCAVVIGAVAIILIREVL